VIGSLLSIYWRRPSEVWPPCNARAARHKGRLRVSLCAAANGPRLHNRLEEGFEG
jgi:hypothetical protein